MAEIALPELMNDEDLEILMEEDEDDGLQMEIKEDPDDPFINKPTNKDIEKPKKKKAILGFSMSFNKGGKIKTYAKGGGVRKPNY